VQVCVVMQRQKTKLRECTQNSSDLQAMRDVSFTAAH
jgi:hypothetical protein